MMVCIENLKEVIIYFFKRGPTDLLISNQAKYDNAEIEDEYGLIDVSPFLDQTKEEVDFIIKRAQENRRQNQGRIVIDEEVPDNIINSLLKLSHIDINDNDKQWQLRSAFKNYYIRD